MNRSRKPTGLVSGPLRLLLSLLIWSFANRDTSLAQSDPAVVNAPTFHYDSQRTGWNSNETVLTPANVASPQFGALWNSPPLDSVVLGGRTYPPHLYATPLYVDAVLITGGAYAGGQFSAVFAATTNNYVYAINAFDSPGPPAVPAGTILWSQSLGTPTNSGLDWYSRHAHYRSECHATPIICGRRRYHGHAASLEGVRSGPRKWKHSAGLASYHQQRHACVNQSK